MRTKLTTMIVLSWLLAACSGIGDQNQAQAITIEAAAMHYQPASIEVTAGQLVMLTFKNNDSVDHDLSVMEIPLVSGTMQESSSPMPDHDMNGMSGMYVGHARFTCGRPGGRDRNLAIHRQPARDI